MYRLHYPSNQSGESAGDWITRREAMAIVRWAPARELAGMEIDRLNRMLAGFLGDAFCQAWMTPVDIYESDDHEGLLKAELPDLKREDISLTFENGVLTIKGERKHEQ